MAVCRTCAAELPDGAQFCPACGTPVRARTGEERKVVTVLFADLVDSTGRADQRDPEDVRAAVRPLLARMRDEIEHHGGTFEKYVGDAVMAVFGAPVAHEDDPERAVRAALAIRDSIEGVRVAVNTGEAVVTLSAAPGSGEGIATGDVVNTAFRIEEAARPETVLVGELTYRSTQSAIAYGERRQLQAKGKAEPVPFYEALRARTELHASFPVVPPLAPLVGRREELSLILDTLARAKRDRTVQLVTLVGVPGIGKSRLAWELQRALEDEPGLVTWRRGRCLPYGDGVTFWALGEMIKAQAQILETDDDVTAEAKLQRCVRDLIPDSAEADWVEAHVRPLVGLGVAGTVQEERREPAFAAWRRLFEGLADWGPLVLLFEDLHWADEGLLDFIEHLADCATGIPLLLLCTARAELYEHRVGWGGRPNAATITLAPLSADETGRLVGYLLRQRVVPAELQQALLAHAGGNPFYAEEFVRMLVDRGYLRRNGSGWQLRDVELPLPESVQGIIASRLDTLGAEEKTLLQDAAVVGRTFWAGALAAMRTEARAAVELLLHALERKEFVQRVRSSSVAGEGEYCFHHSLIRDVAYGQIPRARRADKHVAAASWLESLGRPDDLAETVAHHYLCALDFARAAGQDPSDFAAAARTALREAGERALALYAHPAAARFFAAAVELAAPDDVDRLELVHQTVSSAFAAGHASAEELERARDELLGAGAVERGAELESMLGVLASQRGDQATSLAHRWRAVELLREWPSTRAKAYVLANLASHLLLAGEYEEAIHAGRTALLIAEDLGLAELRSRGLRTIGMARTARGDLAGIQDVEQSIEIARETNSPDSVVGFTNLAGIHMYVGNLGRSFELRDEARRAAARFGDVPTARWLEIARGGELYWLGHWDEALHIVDALIREVEAGTPHYLEIPSRIARGHIRLARGQLESALSDAEKALETARRARDIQVFYPALAFRARAFVEAGQTADGASSADELLAQLEPAGVLPGWFAWGDLACALFELGRGSQLVDWAEKAPVSTRWLDAATAYASGELLRAAELYAGIGSRVDEAFARRRAAGLLEAGGRRREAAEQLERARAFFRSVGAVRYLDRAEVAPLATPRRL